MKEIIDRLEKLGSFGLIVSICYGSCGNMGLMYSVDVMCQDGQSFEKPFVADTFIQCIEIAEKESSERGWITN